jgi:hypothetical protein
MERARAVVRVGLFGVVNPNEGDKENIDKASRGRKVNNIANYVDLMNNSGPTLWQ